MIRKRPEAKNLPPATIHYPLTALLSHSAWSLDQRQVEQTWQEARILVPKPELLLFAAFQFDPEAAKDIDEMKSDQAGMQLLKAQMNADLLTADLKKKRASKECF